MTDVAQPDPQRANPRGAIKRYVIGQFRQPHGVMGRVAGLIMARRSSNRRRNIWTVELMGLEPEHRVLEVGFGPGIALKEACRFLDRGTAVGIDHAPAMRDMAARRNRHMVANGRLRLFVGTVGDDVAWRDPALTGPFDRIFGINVAMFWRDPVEVLTALSKRLAPGGETLLTFQPRMGDQTDAAVRAAGDAMADDMRRAGLIAIQIETLQELSPTAICVIGKRPEPEP